MENMIAVKEIKDEKVLNAIKSQQGLAACSNGYYAKVREIEGMNFVLWCNSHASLRNSQRAYMDDNSCFIDRFIDAFTQDEDTFWDLLDYKEAILISDENKEAFFCAMSSSNINGVIVNSIYIKTYLSLNGRDNVFVGIDDGIVGEIPNLKIMRK